MWARLREPEMVLPAAHARVLRTALGCLSDLIGWEEATAGWESGLSVLDRLTQGQQQTALLTIGRALLERQAPAPRVTAALAAAVSATYDTLLGLIETDILSEDGGTELRRQVLAAVAETGYWQQVQEGLPAQEVLARPPAEWCADVVQWAELVNALRDEVLDDYDHALEEELVDLEPDAAGAVKGLLAIDRDYFVTVPEDPSPARLLAMHQELISLLRGDDGSR